MHVELPHDEVVMHTVLKRDGVGEMAASRVEKGPFGLGERGQALGEVSFGEEDEVTKA
jgi:hypothetical protein